jgi:hypothetical protein
MGEVLEIVLEGLAVVPPRLSIHTGGSLLLQAEVSGGGFLLLASTAKASHASGGENRRRSTHGARPSTLSPLFTAFIPVGQSLNPVTKTNWENVGVEPDVTVPSERALAQAHALALRKLVEREKDPEWKNDLRHAVQNLR